MKKNFKKGKKKSNRWVMFERKDAKWVISWAYQGIESKLPDNTDVKNNSLKRLQKLKETAEIK